MIVENLAQSGLILSGGVPGSGKSTLAHSLLRLYTARGIASRWWYAEEAGHPLYLFHDAAALQRVLHDLAAGNHQQVIGAVLERWRTLSQEIQASGTVMILDGCLFGYLTWTLFPFDIPEEVITAYLTQVERIIRTANSCLIYLYQDNVGEALRKICQRRGGNTKQRFIRNATESAYGKRRGLRGFGGMVSFWQSYRAITDGAFARIRFPKLAIENSAGDWLGYQHTALRFLDFPTTDAPEVIVQDLNRFVGDYRDRSGDAESDCRVRMAKNALLIDDLPLVWPENRLFPISVNRFAVESFPFTVQFEEDGRGAIEGMVVTGAALLSGTIDRHFVRPRDETE